MNTVSTVARSQGENNFNISIILLVFMVRYASSSVQNERFQLNCKDVKENGFYKISTPSYFNKGWNASDLSEENWVSNNTNIAVIVFHAMALECNFTKEVLRVNPGEIILHQCMNVTLISFLLKGQEIRMDFILVPEETTDAKWIGGETRKRIGLIAALILFGSVIVALFCSCLYKRCFNRFKSEMQHATNI
ncbi:hypothetical protein HHUSO_G32980 [Huso huso]|uniref:Uncharacterized protein n=1 Tax=Huso huso TaxID=61971 RepID=A0ABR0Y8U4_HUSHU